MNAAGAPPQPFDADANPLTSGQRLYRVHNNIRTVGEFNHGFGSRTRLAFFGRPAVPVLYAADTEEAALAESLLHDIPVSGGILPYAAYANKVMGKIEVTRTLRLANLRGPGLDWLIETCSSLHVDVLPPAPR